MQFKIDQKYYPYSRYSIVGISGLLLTYSASIVFKGPTALPHTHLSFGATCPPPPSPILTNLSLLQDLLVKTLIYYLLHSMLCCLNYFSWKMFQSLTIPMTLSSTALYKNLNLMSNFYLSIRLGTLGDLQPLILVSTRESVLLVSCGKTYCTHMYIQYVTFTPAVLDCYSCGVV